MKKLIMVCLLVSVMFASSVKNEKRWCDGGSMHECYYLGVAYYYGKGVKKDKQKAFELFSKACEGGFMEGCKLLKKLESKE